MAKRGYAPRAYCRKAGHDMSVTRQFQPNGKVFCGECKRARQRIDRKTKRYLRRRPSAEQKRAYDSRHKFGVAINESDILLAQNGKCAICLAEFGDKLKPQLDHSHATGKIRGLLCRNCNLGIGLFRDNPEFLNSAREYLSK